MLSLPRNEASLRGFSLLGILERAWTEVPWNFALAWEALVGNATALSGRCNGASIVSPVMVYLRSLRDEHSTFTVADSRVTIVAKLVRGVRFSSRVFIHSRDQNKRQPLKPRRKGTSWIYRREYQTIKRLFIRRIPLVLRTTVQKSVSRILHGNSCLLLFLTEYRVSPVNWYFINVFHTSCLSTTSKSSSYTSERLFVERFPDRPVHNDLEIYRSNIVSKMVSLTISDGISRLACELLFHKCIPYVIFLSTISKSSPYKSGRLSVDRPLMQPLRNNHNTYYILRLYWKWCATFWKENSFRQIKGEKVRNRGLIRT